MELKIKYKYDSKRNLIEINRYNFDGALIDKNTYKYDDNGNKIEENNYGSDGTLESKSKYKYEFDKTGNWIKRLDFYFDKPISINERLIKYY